jgi:hypothetical protein
VYDICESIHEPNAFCLPEHRHASISFTSMSIYPTSCSARLQKKRGVMGKTAEHCP